MFQRLQSMFLISPFSFPTCFNRNQEQWCHPWNRTGKEKKTHSRTSESKKCVSFIFLCFVIHSNFDFQWSHRFFASQVKTERDVLCRQSAALLMKWENPEVVMEDLLKVENLMHDSTNKDQNVSHIFLLSKITSW